MIRFTSGSLFKVISLCKSGRRYSDEKIAEMLFPNVEYTTNYIGHQFDIPALKPGDTAVVNVEMDSRYFEGTYTVIWEMKMSDGTLCFPNKEKEFSFDVTVKSDM